MQKTDFLLLLDELLELELNTLTGTEKLEGLETWDSLASIGFIALVDEKFDISLSASKLNACQTIDDLVALVSEKITS
jgi:acyl carrier protein